MNKILRIITISIALTAAMATHAADTADSTAVASRLLARNCFTTAPEDVLPLLEPQTRQDMLSYHDAGRDTPSKNALGSECRILSLDDDIMRMESGTGITTEIFVLNPTGKNQVIGVIETVNTPVPDSRVTFYDTKWRNLSGSLNVDPSLADWLPKSHKGEIADIQRAVPFVLATMHFDPYASTLTLENGMQSYYPEKQIPEALSMVKPRLTYKWTGKKFRLEK